jgi:hypothetical protein
VKILRFPGPVVPAFPSFERAFDPHQPLSDVA